MIILYYLEENQIKRKEHSATDTTLPPHIVWIDLLKPSLEEEKYLEANIGVEIPTNDEMREIEVSSRLYYENNAYYMTATMICHADSPTPETDAVTFILYKQMLVTVRYINPQPFQLFCSRLTRPIHEKITAQTLLNGLLDYSIDRIADILEKTGRNIDRLTQDIFGPSAHTEHPPKPNFHQALQNIGMNGDIAARARESLVSFNRLITYLNQASGIILDTSFQTSLVTLAKDVSSLSDHVTFLSNKLNFLLDATLGMINIEQNAIIKIFSVAAVIFMPPTLIASIYGMNFHLMPELDWRLGYPLAVMMMMVASWLPYKYFKKRKWL